MNVLTENDKCVAVHFSSISELMEYEPQRHRDRFKRYMTQKDSSRWYGGGRTSAEEVIRSSIIGDEDLYANVMTKVNHLKQHLDAEGFKEIEDDVQAVRRVRRRKDQGDELDIHAVLQGRIDRAWQKTEREEFDKKHNLFTLMIDIGGNCDKNAEDSLWRAAVTVMLADKLIKAGKSVRIMAGGCSSRAMYGAGRNKTLTTDIVIKEYNEPLSMERLAAMANLGFFRVFNFAAMVCVEKYEVASNLGYSSNYLKYYHPIWMEEEIAAGHTKYIFVDQVLSPARAISELQRLTAEAKSEAA